MRTIRQYRDEHDVFLHPLWLGSLLLFSVIIVLGLLCLIRRRCGLQIYNLCYTLCYGRERQAERSAKTPKELSITNQYSWTPAYNPAPSLSPKLYALVRNIHADRIDPESSSQKTNNHDDNVDDDVFSIPEEPHEVKKTATRQASQTSQGSGKNRNCETARKFYASMRHTSECKTSISLDSYNNEPTLGATDRSSKTNRNDRLQFFHTPRFFHSIEKTLR